MVKKPDSVYTSYYWSILFTFDKDRIIKYSTPVSPNDERDFGQRLYNKIYVMRDY